MQDLGTFLPLSITLIGVSAGAFVAGFAGIGFAAAAGALLLHVLPSTTAIPLMMLCSVIAQSLGLISLRKSMDFRGAAPFVLSGLVAIPIGLHLLQEIDTGFFKAWFGAFLFLYSLYSKSRLWISTAGLGSGADRPEYTRSTVLTPVHTAWVGFAGGLIGDLTAMPGAVLSVWADIRGGGDKADRRSVLQPFILSMQVVALLCMAANEQLLRADIMGLFAVSIPLVVLGTGLGLMLFGRVRSDTFRSCVLGLVLVSGLTLMAV